jgi:predicted nicotinamide N-methyase
MAEIQEVEFVLEHTRPTSPYLCPELSLRLITPECPLWRADERDLLKLNLPEPFWGFCWAGGQALARYVLDHPDRVAGKRVLDFGAGCGVAGIAAKRAGARRVCAADTDPLAAVAAAINAQLNGVELEITTRDLLGERVGGFEVILLGDMFYEAELAERVQDWLTGSADVKILMGSPDRGHIDAELWTRVAQYEAPADVDADGSHLRDAAVYAIT